MYKKVIAVLVVGALLIAGGVYAYRALLAESEETEGPTYATAEVTRGDMKVSVQGFGKLNPIYSGRITTETGGALKNVEINQGDEVKEGQVVAHLENEELVREIEKLNMQLDRGRTELAHTLGVSKRRVLEVDPNRGISITAPIAGRVTDLRADVDQSVKSGVMVARIVDDSVVVIVAECNPAQFEEVEEGMSVQMRVENFAGTVPGRVVDASSVPVPKDDHYVHEVIIHAENPGLLRPGHELDVLLGSNTSVHSTIDRFKEETLVWSPAEGTVVDVPVREGQRVKKGEALVVLGGSATTQFIYDKQMDVMDLKEQLSQKERQREKLTVRSPIDGMVGWVMSGGGHLLKPEQGIATIYNNEKMSVDIRVDEVDVVHVKQGMEARVSVDAFPGEAFPAEVTRVEMMGHDEEGITVYPVSLEVNNTEDVRPGMTANVDIYVNEVTDALLVPIEAVYSEEDQAMVDVLKEGVPRARPVEVGLVGSRYAQIEEGLEEGDVVITGSSEDLLESETVEEEQPSVVPGG